jgi:hypothetical protein
MLQHPLRICVMYHITCHTKGIVTIWMKLQHEAQKEFLFMWDIVLVSISRKQKVAHQIICQQYEYILKQIFLKELKRINMLASS